MKKILIMLLAAAMMTSIISCGEEETEGNSENKEVVENIDKEEGDTTEDDGKEEEQIPEEEEKLLKSTYRFPLADVCVDVPDYIEMEAGCTRVFRNGETKFITFTCCFNDVASDVKESFDVVYPTVTREINSWYWIDGEPTFTESEAEVNGIKALKVEGTVPIGMVVPTDCYTYGYSFIFDGVPCAIIGVVSDKTQPQEEIDSLKEIVDAMMESVRSKG